MIYVTQKGDYRKTREYLNRLLKDDMFSNLDEYGKMGVDSLSSHTPIDTGLASQSWKYRIIKNSYGPKIEWYNMDRENGAEVIILIQYGHATRGGTYIQGYDFINPAMRPVFDYIAKDIGKKVIS